jgi:hypothetical protein
MIKKVLFLSMLLSLGFSVASVPSFATASKVVSSSIALKRITGTIRITSSVGKVITVSRGEKMPTIPFGSQIQVLSGKAEVTVGGVQLFLNESQGIYIARNADSGIMKLAASPESVGSIMATMGESVMQLNSGSILNVGMNANGKPEISSITGDVKTLASKMNQNNKDNDKGNNKNNDRNNNHDNDRFGDHDRDNNINPFPHHEKEDEASPVLPKRR